MAMLPSPPCVTIRPMQAPDVIAYLDYRAFLRDWFEWKKSQNPRYSHRLFARRAGVRSPSLLLLVSEGKRNLTAATTEAFSQAMGLDEDAARHFTLLVRMDQAETSAARAEALEAILATKRFREARRMDAAAYQYFARWWFPAVHELAHRHDFVADAGWVAARLRPSITEAQAEDALQALLELGLLEGDDEGVPRPTDRSVVTPHEVADLALRGYHSAMLGLAAESISGYHRPERHVLGLTAAIPVELVPKVKDRLNEMQRELLSMCDQGPAEQVYQLTMAFFPLSDAPEE